MLFVLLLIFFLVFFLVSWKIVSIGRFNYGTLENSGFPVIPPSFCFGSVPDFYQKIQHDEDISRAKKFGPIWGLYEGREAQVYICDPDLVKQTCLKDFEHFHSRRRINLGPIASEILDYLQGDTWKFMRSKLSPLFTSAKLKWMDESIDDYFKEVNQDLLVQCRETGRMKLEFSKNASAWFINMFARASLGIDVQDHKNPDNVFATAFREMMGETITYSFMHTLVLSFPFLEHLLSPLLDDKPQWLIDSMLRKILAQRRGVRRNNDLADILNDLWDEKETLTEWNITQSTLISQALAFFVGGYDSSHTNVAHLAYFLATNPKIQDELLAEMRSVVTDKNSRITYEMFRDSRMPYLAACLNEALRMGPSFFRPERVCNKDWEYKGYRIKKGTTLMVASWGLHFNPEYFEDPYVFRPERFLPGSPKIDPYVFTPFGHGPRACIGMRFAYESMKLFMINLLLNFQIEKRPDTVLSYKPGTSILAHLDHVNIDLVPRA